MKRVTIHGGSGSGKSTLAAKLSEVTGLPTVHLDKIYWQEDWQPRDLVEADGLVDEALTEESWIVEGIYRRSYQKRMAVADMIIFLDYPTWRLLWRITTRVFQNRGEVRPDMPQGCPERFDWDFMLYVAGYKKKGGVRESITKAMEQAPASAKKITLKSDREIEEFLASIRSGNLA